MAVRGSRESLDRARGAWRVAEPGWTAVGNAHSGAVSHEVDRAGAATASERARLSRPGHAWNMSAARLLGLEVMMQGPDIQA